MSSGLTLASAASGIEINISSFSFTLYPDFSFLLFRIIAFGEIHF